MPNAPGRGQKLEAEAKAEANLMLKYETKLQLKGSL